MDVTRSKSFTASRENEKDIGVSKTKGQKSEGGSDNDLFFEEDEEGKVDDLLLDSPKGSVNSSVLDFDEDQLIDEEEDDEFEDAIGDDDNQIVSTGDQLRKLQELIINDCDEERLQLPLYRDPKIKSSALWTILKDMVGQDITKFSMPVILNEPLSALQRSIEVFDANPILK